MIFPPLTTQLIAASHKLTVQRFGRVIKLFAPLYISNECVDTCTYCGFSRLHKIKRLTLTAEQILAEAHYLIDQGFQHLLLVSGEHPKKVSVPFLCEIARMLRPKLASLAIEVAPFEEADYRTLAQAGVDTVALYQETYDRETYHRYHLGGPKQDYDRRIRLVSEACRAGIRTVGLGILLGLHPWEKELPRLLQHVQQLMKEFWQTQFTISLPRLKPSAAGFVPPHPVSDKDFARMICILRLELPDVGIILSTREPPELRNLLLNMGITQMSAGSRTEPGGYLHPENSDKQFELEDHRSPAEVVTAITNAGYTPVWKDWDLCLATPPQADRNDIKQEKI